MFPLVWSAIAARRASSLVILVLAALTTIGLSIAPGYAAKSTDRAVSARIADTPDAQRTVSAHTDVSLERNAADVLQQFADPIRTALGVPIARELIGAEVNDSLRAGGQRLAVDLRYRDNVCAELVITGDCPHAPGDVILSGQTAGRLGVRAGDTLTYAQVPLRLVGTYRPRDPLAWPWARNGDAAFTTLDTLAKARTTVQATYDVVLADTVFTHPDDYAAGLARLNRLPVQVTTTGGGLTARITADRLAVRRGALIAALQLFVIGLVAMAVAAGYAAQERRLDVGQLLLRGARRWRVVAASSGQSAAPLVLGVLIGYAAAGGLIGAFTGKAGWPDWRIAAAVAVAGVAVAVLADWRATRAPVEQLLRASAPRPPKLSVAVVEASVLALTAASVYQSLSSPDPIGLQLLTPAFLAASVAILLGRLVAPAAASIGRSALVAGRLTPSLAALFLARRVSAYRVLPLLAAGGCLFTVAAQDWTDAAAARHTRSQVEVGGERVLTVATVARAKLVDAVHQADPGGHDAMAAVVGGEPSGVPLVAVDSARLAAVVARPLRFDPAVLHPAAPAPITFAATSLTLTSSVPAHVDVPDLAPRSGVPAVLVHLVALDSGQPATATFTAAAPTQAVPACRTGCRLASLELAAGPAIELRELTGDGKPVVTPEMFADAGRWRTAVGNVATTVSPQSHDGRLALAAVGVGRSRLPIDNALYVVDAPIPLPAVIAGGIGQLTAPPERGTRTISPFGDRAVPVDLVEAPLLPGVGTHGILVDLAYADRAAGAGPHDERQQVWLAAGAPDSVVDRLRAAGLTILATDSIAGADDRQARFGPAAADRFVLLAGAADLILAVLALTVVAAVQRRARNAELRAFRQQGVPVKALRAAGRWSALAPAVLAAIAGVLVAAVARLITRSAVPVFTDGWPDPDGPSGARALALVVCAGLLLVVFGLGAAFPQYTRRRP
jgi:putative ABC transport system permease protein